jgi:hypothetical protein
VDFGQYTSSIIRFDFIMSSQPEQLSSCCVSGHVHAGTPQGTFQSIDGINTYVSKPENGSKAKTLVLLTDVFGPQLPNAQLFADEWAKKGWYAYIPDLFNGESCFPIARPCESRRLT